MMLGRKYTCGNCPYLEEIGSTDTGRCYWDKKLHDIMESACSRFPEDRDMEEWGGDERF